MADDSQACAFEIKVIEGKNRGSLILLEGRMLPYRGVEWETEMRLKTTYYPGNPVATQQTIGPIEKNTVITGMWKDRFLGNGMARAMVQTFRDLARTGTAIQVTWGQGLATVTPITPESIAPGSFNAASLITGKASLKTTADPIVRRGFIKRVKAKFDRPQDVAWEVEFEWRGADDQTKPPVFSAVNVKFTEAISAFSQTLADIRSTIDSFNSRIAGLTDFTAWTDKLDEVQNTIGTAIDTLNTVVEGVSNVAELPNDLLDRCRESFSGVVGACQNGRELFDAIVGDWKDFRLFKDFGADMARLGKQMKAAFTPTDDPLKNLDAFSTTDTTVRGMDRSSEIAADQDAFLASQQVPEIVATVRPPVGSDLRDIALQFYDDPDLWWQIADYNGLDSSEIPPVPVGASDDPARPIYIPRRAIGANAKPFGGAGC